MPANVWQGEKRHTQRWRERAGLPLPPPQWGGVDFRKGGVEISKNAVRGGGSSNRKGGVAKSWVLLQSNSGGLHESSTS